MEEILRLLSDSDIVREYEILNVLQDEDFYYLKIKSSIIDDSILYIKIYLSETEYNYSFHLQKNDGKVIARWDNAPHHKEIHTHPHHKHYLREITESYSITLIDILREIKFLLKKQE